MSAYGIKAGKAYKIVEIVSTVLYYVVNDFGCRIIVCTNDGTAPDPDLIHRYGWKHCEAPKPVPEKKSKIKLALLGFKNYICSWTKRG